MMIPRRNKLLLFVLAGGTLLVGAVAFYRHFGFGIPCPIYTVTGLYCPGCGTMRALNALASFQVKKALSYNGFVVLLLPLFVYLLVGASVQYLQNAPPKHSKANLYGGIAIAVAGMVFMLLRNLPWFAFLAP